MSTPEGSSSREITLAIKLDPARHAQLTWIAELRGTTLKAESFKAVDAYIEAAKQDPELIAKATAAREEIERQARERQEAIANLFTAPTPPPPIQEDETESGESEAKGTRRSTGRRGPQASE
ncbi:hypothetical protein BOX37_07700 [Nocardia mangyaensis]|uniref:Uncharacterized protein n=1 Tax=Nocardia mangyaensis TaxID=2213200 RepID=A0A1J0VPD5_9NOCA|nr:hypothetical protein [Nocardia mangyaensis]APE33874.1 hypothetical protein BOX37_07700 [Nocardia mangyaensis]